MSLPVVAIVGRPNVGKSTLFNKLIGRGFAVVSDEAGTTRDRIFAKVEKCDFPFFAVDTGGIEIDAHGKIEENIKKQGQIAIEEADVILFLVDGSSEATSEDEEVVDLLRRQKKPVILGIAKCDSGLDLATRSQYFRFGFKEIVAFSTFHNNGISDLLTKINNKIKEIGYTKSSVKKEEEKEVVGNLALVGRPNVGKSSLVNAFLSEERLIVSDISGTTRDSVDTEIHREGKNFNLIDTAGIRRSGKIEKGIEKYSIIRTLQSIERSDVCCLLLDPEEGITSQDQAVVKMITEQHKGLILVVNKWDLVEKGEEAREAFFHYLRVKFPFLPWAPVVFVSAKTKRGIVKIFPIVEQIIEERKKRIPTGKLNRFIEKIQREHVPTGTKNIKPKIFFFSQVDVNPPSFKIFVNKEKYFHFSYFRYIENKIRETFGFAGTCIKIEVTDRKSIYQKGS